MLHKALQLKYITLRRNSYKACITFYGQHRTHVHTAEKYKNLSNRKEIKFTQVKPQEKS